MKKNFKNSNNGKLSKRPPVQLGGIAQAMWRKIVPVLEDESAVEKIDANLVELYCSQYEIYRDAYKHIRENGSVQAIYHTLQDNLGEKIGTDFAGYKRNPSTQIYSDAVAKLTKLGSELGLSPKSRAELMNIQLDDDQEDDEAFEEAFKKLGGG
ncbi:phage terminase small subunit P27 family [Oenococcus oeni]|uniref:phage terminase small subunit P27 family n=1 Tax=Oenococcus oeni TaxID=1247 RepID=UPI0010B6C75E|nr:phage terminase small subunit P27 family [Oenococcus oeni]SYW19489.1 Terminase [Oenococcus oeni]